MAAEPQLTADAGESGSQRSRSSEGRRVDVLGVGVSVTSIAQTIATVHGWIDEGAREYICVTSVHGVMECQSDPQLTRAFNGSGLTVPDGMPMVWAGRFAGAADIERVYGPELMIELLAEAERQGWSSYFYGGDSEVPDLLARRLQARFPRLRVADGYSPPYRELTVSEKGKVRAQIEGSGADIVWVGLSTPKQERWMDEFAGLLRRPAVLIGVGAAFDVHAGLIRPPPTWMGPLGLFWVYRLLQEPRRLWRRYVVLNPRFVYAILRKPPRLRD